MTAPSESVTRPVIAVCGSDEKEKMQKNIRKMTIIRRLITVLVPESHGHCNIVGAIRRLYSRRVDRVKVPREPWWVRKFDRGAGRRRGSLLDLPQRLKPITKGSGYRSAEALRHPKSAPPKSAPSKIRCGIEFSRALPETTSPSPANA